MSGYDAVVIGAGVGGLSAAIHLAHAGQKVLVLEKNHAIGGKMGEHRAAGFRWDTGPSVITMRPVLEELFRLSSQPLDEYLILDPVHPLTRYFYPDGSVLDVDPDPRITAEQLAHFHPADREGYLDFLDYVCRIYEATGDVFLFSQPPSWRTLFKLRPGRLMGADPFRTMQRAIEDHVSSPQARQFLGRFATYSGASPYLAPATLNVIAHVELNQGIWYPRGGIYRLAEAVGRLADELGVTIETDSPVTRIEYRDRTVSAVISGRRRIETGCVIANLDVATVYEKLLSNNNEVEREAARLEQMALSSSGFVLMLGVEGVERRLAHHNVFFSDNYAEEFDQIFSQGRLPTTPTIYVAITSVSEPKDAPIGAQNWFILVNTPPLGPHVDWEAERHSFRDRILDRLARPFGLDIRGRIRYESWLDPHDLEQWSGARRGALYGISANDRWAAFRRPHNRSASIRGLYFAGGTTHPGGGIPLVALSGKVAAEMALSDRQDRRP